jgi:hypothetical protein
MRFMAPRGVARPRFGADHPARRLRRPPEPALVATRGVPLAVWLRWYVWSLTGRTGEIAECLGCIGIEES